MERPIKPRRNSDKRREKSRDAARQRRTQETSVFTELAQNLPIPNSKSSQLDKASIMRLTLTALKQKQLKALLCGGRKKEDEEVTEEEQRNLALHPKALDGFLLVISKEGEILFLSEQVVKFLGIVQVEFLGQSIFEYTHPCDHDEFREMLSDKFHACEQDPYRRSFSVRLKCTLTNKGRNINIKSASYKVIKFTGKIILLPKPDDNDTVNVKIENGNTETAIVENDKTENGNLMTYLFAFGEQIPHPSNIEVPLGQKTFLSQHSMDMKFTIWDEKIKELVGYNSDDIIGRPLYDYYHVLDGELVGKTFKDLMGKGQIMTEQYRFLAKRGGHVWVVTQATIIYDQRSQKSQYVVCVHYVLSEIMDRHEIVSIVQMAGCDDEEEVEDVKEEVVVIGDNVLVDPVQSPSSEDSIPGPQLNTEKIFAPKTKDMEEEIFAQNNTAIPVNESLQDLTYRAPSAGDVCISLPFPTFGNDINMPDSMEMVKLKDEPMEETNVYVWDSNEELTFQQSPHVDLITPPSTDSEAQDFSKDNTTCYSSDPMGTSYGSCFSTDLSPGSCISTELSPGSCTVNHPDDTTTGFTSDPMKTSYGPCFATDLSPGSCISTELSPGSSIGNTSEMTCPPDYHQHSSLGEDIFVKYSTMDTNIIFNGRPYYNKTIQKDAYDKGKSLYEQEEWKLKNVFPDYKIEPYCKNEMTFNVFSANSPESPKKSPDPDLPNNVPNIQLMQNGSDLSHAKRQIDISCLEKGPPEKKIKFDSSPLPFFGNFHEESLNSPVITEEPNTDSVLRNLLVNGEDLNNGYSVNRPLTSPNLMADLLCFDSKSMPMSSNRSLLPRLTQSDCDVNAPVPSNGLLRGNEILKALEVDTSVII